MKLVNNQEATLVKSSAKESNVQINVEQVVLDTQFRCLLNLHIFRILDVLTKTEKHGVICQSTVKLHSEFLKVAEDAHTSLRHVFLFEVGTDSPLLVFKDNVDPLFQDLYVELDEIKEGFNIFEFETVLSEIKRLFQEILSMFKEAVNFDFPPKDLHYANHGPYFESDFIFL